MNKKLYILSLFGFALSLSFATGCSSNSDSGSLEVPSEVTAQQTQDDDLSDPENGDEPCSIANQDTQKGVLIRNIYQRVLGRDPVNNNFCDMEGFQYWYDELPANPSPEDCQGTAQSIIQGKEFQDNHSALTDITYMAKIYKVITSVDVPTSDEGVVWWSKELKKERNYDTNKHHARYNIVSRPGGMYQLFVEDRDYWNDLADKYGTAGVLCYE